MSKWFDKKKWSRALLLPNWYIELFKDIDTLFDLASEDKKNKESIKEAVYGFFENKLRDDKIALADTGKNLDSQRAKIDTIVIHHTSNQSGMSLERLNAMHLLRLYYPHYYNKAKKSDFKVTDPIFSNHFRNSKQVFYGYHWLVRMDGKVERLLNDNEIGWHAGDWDVNCRSIAICLDNDYEYGRPTKIVLESIVNLIKELYPWITRGNIVGHCEVNHKTICPGNEFLANWKKELLLLY